MKYIWRQLNVGFWKEAVRGTAVVPSFWYPKTTIDFDEKVETIVDESSLWVKIKSSNLDVIKRTGEWAIEWLARVNSIWLLLLNILWKDTVSEIVAGNVYSHLFEVENSNVSPSLSIWIAEPNGDYNFPLAMLKSMSISAKIGEYITINCDFKSKKWETTSHTVTYTTDDYYFTVAHSLFKMANDIAWLPASADICIESFELTVNKEMSEDFCLNGWVDLVDQTDWAIEVTWSIVATFKDETTFKDVALAWTYKAMSLKVEDTNTDLGSWNYPTIEITLPKVWFTDYGRDKWNDWVIKQNLWFTAMQDITSWKAIDVKVINSVTSY